MKRFWEDASVSVGGVEGTTRKEYQQGSWALNRFISGSRFLRLYETGEEAWVIIEKDAQFFCVHFRTRMHERTLEYLISPPSPILQSDVEGCTVFKLAEGEVIDFITLVSQRGTGVGSHVSLCYGPKGHKITHRVALSSGVLERAA